MEVVLKKSFFTTKYKFLVKETGEEIIGRIGGFYIFSRLKLYRNQKLVIKANRRFLPLFKGCYEVIYNDNVGEFRSLRIFKPNYELELCQDNYEVVGHYGKKSSIFQNSIQIASLLQLNTISFNDNDSYRIMTNDDVDLNIILLTVMMMDDFTSGNTNGNLLMIDLGNIIGEVKPFDENWKPNKNINSN